MLHINNLEYNVEGRALFAKASATLSEKWRVGIVGRNGTGKTTLFRLIDGSLSPDRGEITLAGRRRIGQVAQEAPGGETSLIDTVLKADRERTALLKEAESAADPMRIAEIHERLTTIRADSAPARASRILAGLGFDEAAQNRPCSSYSGGWRMRVALAALLFSEPDLLLLDEPTNHLDLEATLWLENYLANYPGTLLLISHDRQLLNNIPDHVLHLEGGKLTLYNGNYDTFARTRQEKLEHEAAYNAKVVAQRKHIQAFVDRFRAKANKAKQAQSRIKMLERLQTVTTVVDDHKVSLNFPKPEPLAPPIITLENAEVGYPPDPPVLRNLNLRVDLDDRIALLGANGNGKSTLARLLAGRLSPLAGNKHNSGKLRVGYFAQDQSEELDYSATPIENLARLMPEAKPQAIRNHLGRFGFSGNHAETPVNKLSGGEKARLLFALISRENPHLLILDEPTNHLDIDARDALMEALNDFEGAIILVSHDAYLVETVAERLWLVQNGSVESYQGDMEEYRQLLLDQRREERRRSQEDKARTPSGQSRKEQRREAAQNRAALAELRKSAKAMERKLAKLGEQKQKVEDEMADSALYTNDPQRAALLQKQHAELVQDISQLEEDWLKTQERLETAG
ncbi:ABC-F family ATP-binding cassette domain-containing protein [Fodinicurvata fenggangensis]|uniref:ABC-F family ATP-binding cassette domain-containing protein n=1 Tax=Fodinicurvata fenggangensis TaxID=1121830 RepID=UPI00047A6A8D|nr:ABC-F family ATP-binding cassette domain-containing protein [Fodinicurvata fenggangensis]